MSENKKDFSPLIILTAGGTGGHVYPAEALAGELSRRGYRLLLVTDRRGLNNYRGTLGEIRNIAVFAGAMTGKSRWFKLKSLIKTAAGILQSMWVILKEKPACVVGFGGYASFPCSLAAVLLGVDLIIHEQNSVMSRTNRFLAKYAAAVATSFKKTKYAPAGRKTILTGMPVRESIAALSSRPRPKTGKNAPFHILVIGGSQGAAIFSETVPEAVGRLSPVQQKHICIMQQCRAEDVEKVRKIYDGYRCKAVVAPFFNNMPELYACSHLVISRAGASSVAEIEAAGRASILVPLPTAADDHQTANAAELKNNKGSMVFSQKNFTPSILTAALNDLLQNPQIIKTMSENAARLAVTDAAGRLADLLAARLSYFADQQTRKK